MIFKENFYIKSLTKWEDNKIFLTFAAYSKRYLHQRNEGLANVTFDAFSVLINTCILSNELIRFSSYLDMNSKTFRFRSSLSELWMKIFAQILQG